MTVFKKLLFGSLIICTLIVNAEQKQEFSGYDVHYVVLPTTFLNAKIATQYGIVRSQDRALVNISVLSANGDVLHAKVAGSIRNLLSQSTPLIFEEVVETSAIYYLSEFKHTDRDRLEFNIEVTPKGLSPGTFRFRQIMYVSE